MSASARATAHPPRTPASSEAAANGPCSGWGARPRGPRSGRRPCVRQSAMPKPFDTADHNIPFTDAGRPLTDLFTARPAARPRAQDEAKRAQRRRPGKGATRKGASSGRRPATSETPRRLRFRVLRGVADGWRSDQATGGQRYDKQGPARAGRFAGRLPTQAHVLIAGALLLAAIAGLAAVAGRGSPPRNWQRPEATPRQRDVRDPRGESGTAGAPRDHRPARGSAPARTARRGSGGRGDGRTPRRGRSHPLPPTPLEAAPPRPAPEAAAPPRTPGPQRPTPPARQAPAHPAPVPPGSPPEFL